MSDVRPSCVPKQTSVNVQVFTSSRPENAGGFAPGVAVAISSDLNPPFAPKRTGPTPDEFMSSRPEEPPRASALHHRNVHASDLALGADQHGLLVAGGLQRQGGGKSGSLDEHVDPSAARGALKVAENIAAGFAPVAGNAVALARHIAAQVELVAVASAMQALLQAEARAVDLVVGLASDALGRSVGKRNRPVAGP